MKSMVSPSQQGSGMAEVVEVQKINAHDGQLPGHSLLNTTVQMLLGLSQIILHPQVATVRFYTLEKYFTFQCCAVWFEKLMNHVPACMLLCLP